jgi:hypothetical protein
VSFPYDLNGNPLKHVIPAVTKCSACLAEGRPESQTIMSFVIRSANLRPLQKQFSIQLVSVRVANHVSVSRTSVTFTRRIDREGGSSEPASLCSARWAKRIEMPAFLIQIVFFAFSLLPFATYSFTQTNFPLSKNSNIHNILIIPSQTNSLCYTSNPNKLPKQRIPTSNNPAQNRPTI